MKPSILALLLLSACGTSSSGPPTASSTTAGSVSAAPVTASAPRLVPSRSIGPISLGMTRAEVAKLGLPVLSHPSGQMGDDVRLVGPYHVVFRADKVDSIELEVSDSPSGVVIGARTFSPSATAQEMVGALTGCAAEQPGEGGSTVACEGRRTLIKRGASCVARAPNGACLQWDPQRPGVTVQVLASPL